MAQVSGNICIGKAVITVGPYVTAGGAGTLVDVGHTKGPTTLATAFENYDAVSEQAPTPLESVPSTTTYKLKVPVEEATIDNWLIASREPVANKSGTPPAFTLRVGGPTGKKYHQIQIVTAGLGATLTRTITIWKAVVESVSEIPFAKGGEQLLEVTVNCLYDDTVTTADKVMKIVDS
jgi:hypothetical protein